MRTPAAHHEQTSRWGDAQRFAGWRAGRLICRLNGKIVGGAQVLEKPIGRFGWTVGYLNRGPLLNPDSPELHAELIRALQRHARQRRMVYMAVVLPYDGTQLESELLAAGFHVSPEALPPSTAMKATSVLDLAPPEEELLAAMRSKTRQHIRKSLKSGLVLRRGAAEDVSIFQQLLEALCRRRGVSSNVPRGEFVSELWAQFSTGGNLQLFLVEKDGAVVAAMLLFATGQWVRAWRFGWAGNFADSYPTELIYWEAIKWARAGGYRYFDFAGFDTEYARAIVAQRPLVEGKICKISFFKQGFGGRILPLFPSYCYFPNPLLRVVFRCGGARFLDSGLFRVLRGLTNKRRSLPE
jgi:lipid II:glycine glycyltransferase (peptidoglycan interpeptide bridge formation enzyme)